MAGTIIPPPQQIYPVTGTSNSRLTELKKYTISSIFSEMYVQYNGHNDGVDFNNSIPDNKIYYYIGEIKYTDDIINDKTTFRFNTIGINNPQFITAPLFKTPSKENIIGNPKIDNDVFIVRQELSAFDKNFKLEHLNNLAELNAFAGGNYFNIIKVV